MVRAEEYIISISQTDVMKIFDGEMQYQGCNLDNTYLCQSLLSHVTVEKVPRAYAYNLVIAVKSYGINRAAIAMPLVDINGAEEDLIKMLTIRNKEKGMSCPTIVLLRWL